ncbi:hypothetical protein C1646_725946 [Rhizophagus diaphanus]|nr:hypothetical protein C1646_725946 [Rhizophagus diaphanus] [Rhizophagus sp. MUCL 43196]
MIMHIYYLNHKDEAFYLLNESIKSLIGLSFNFGISNFSAFSFIFTFYNFNM